MPSLQRRTKKQCVKKNTTRRCVKSFDQDDTSASCKFFHKTQRCRSLVADEKFVEYQNYRVRKTVVSFLKKKLGRTLPELIALAKREDPDYEDTLQFLLENPRKTPSQIKRDLESEILELAANSARDDEGSDIITLKAVKKVLTRSAEFKFLLK
jgi:hypothetical protein